MSRRFISVIALLCVALLGNATEYQWSVKLKGYVSGETEKDPDAFLWIPSTCERVDAIVFSQQNMSEETLFDMPGFRKAMSHLNFGIVWVSPGFSLEWDVKQGVQEVFNQMMTDFADVSGYDELHTVPIVPLGHSAMATFPWNFAAWNPERTLAIVSLHGDAPRTNLTGYGRENLEWGRTRNIDGIPGLMIEGEYEWWEARVNPALAFRMMYPQSCISFLCDAGRGHFDVAEETAEYIALFLKKAAQQRLPVDKASAKLLPVNPHEGWLAQRWHPNQKRRSKTAAFDKYKGDTHDAFWYFDKEMAQLTEERYARSRGKKTQYISFVQNGEFLAYNEHRHVKVQPSFQPDADGITFYLKAVFTDSLYQQLSNSHVDVAPRITKVCGPVAVVNDTTFRVDFFRMGMHNPRRTGGISLVADCPGDKRYNSAVQHIGIHIPYRNSEGVVQTIRFATLPDANVSAKSILLSATSDSGLPVSYYVKEGPAMIEGDVLTFTDIPPRAKLPLKVTVVAWQYGIQGKVQTAEPVEQSFYITR